MDDAVRVIDDSLRFCKNNEIIKLLADVTQITHLRPPSLVDRFWLITKWAESARGRVKLAVVAPGEIIHPEKIGVMFGANRGLEGDIFVDEDEAIEWLSAVLA